MYIKISRLFIIIFASIFIGMSIIFYVQYVTNNLSPTLPIICILSMLLLMAFVFAVQYTNNRSDKKNADNSKPTNTK